ncbi:Uncharacterised protein [Yersinia frederiksenii]|nr:Uncharacterised protein [Yersinia frederiksenii]CNI09753.1 Uncharacterised protein [Yersinia frederiksenii]CNI66895.1 Uncharacterised protein [Yersinia frederiksenii]CNK29535.1 Uncharacterised protein [Yersinia frederiksenii]CNK54567.1 Uncharacterised protein [Yersinia frederiksenii]
MAAVGLCLPGAGCGIYLFPTTVCAINYEDE